MADKKRKKKKYKLKKIIKRTVTVLLAAVALALGAFLLFRVHSFKIEGNIPYSKEEVITASGIKKGDSLFSLDTQTAKKNIELQLPYADDVRISKKLPFTVVIKAKKAKQTYAVLMGKGVYAITNENTKILEVSSVIPEGTIMVEGGIKSSNYAIGTKVDFAQENGDEAIRMALTDISMATESSSLENIDYINVADYSNIYLIYEDRIIIKVGGAGDLIQKISLAKKSLAEENKLSSTQYGELDVSAVSKAVFMPKDYKNMDALVAYDENMAAVEEKILDIDNNM